MEITTGNCCQKTIYSTNQFDFQHRRDSQQKFLKNEMMRCGFMMFSCKIIESQLLEQYLNMRKVPSYPKITTKTNITVMQTQNININSPKGITVGFPNGKKAFKATKSTTEKAEEPEAALHPSRSKLNHHLNKPTINTRRQSSGNLNKPSKMSESKQDSNFEEVPTNKQDLRKIEQKLKELEKKIETLKSEKKRKKELTSHRSHSKIKDAHITTILQKKPALSTFGKKKAGSVTKILKKAHSDKYLLRPQTKKQSESKMDMTSSKHDESELIHKFVTQVVRSDAQKGEKMHHQEESICYYIQNAMESLSKAYLLPFKEHLLQSLQTLKYLQNNRKPSPKQIEKHSVTLPPSKFKATLILDLDETLIHCNENLSLPHDVTLKIKFPTGEKIDAGVNVRPFAIDLLRQLSKKCEIIVFTASHECYANVVLDHLDPKREFISHRLFRSQCWQTEEGVYIKDLRVIKNRNLENMLLVDNAAYSYLYQLENGVPIVPFYQDKDDQQLMHLIKYVHQVMTLNEKTQIPLRDLNQKYFQLATYMSCEGIQTLTNMYRDNVARHREMIV